MRPPARRGARHDIHTHSGGRIPKMLKVCYNNGVRAIYTINRNNKGTMQDEFMVADFDLDEEEVAKPVGEAEDEDEEEDEEEAADDEDM